MSYRLSLTLVFTLLLISGCAPAVKAPVRSLSGSTPQQAELAESTYRVKKGDTLYSIAFRYGLNYRGLARRNDISEPYRIQIDQIIILSDEIPLGREVVNPSNEEIIRPSRQEIKAPTQTRQTASKPPTSSYSTAKPAIKKPSTPRSKFDTNTKVQQWLWPIASSKQYSKKPGNQLLFKVKEGTPVRSVAAGRVVYSGKGLVGYGHLIIIKHNQNLLSAYAFNDEVLIKEKQTVSAGQKIATVGTSPTGEIGLGFEIRSRGKPVNPLTYLR